MCGLSSSTSSTGATKDLQVSQGVWKQTISYWTLGIWKFFTPILAFERVTKKEMKRHWPVMANVGKWLVITSGSELILFTFPLLIASRHITFLSVFEMVIASATLCSRENWQSFGIASYGCFDRRVTGLNSIHRNWNQGTVGDPLWFSWPFGGVCPFGVLWSMPWSIAHDLSLETGSDEICQNQGLPVAGFHDVTRQAKIAKKNAINTVCFGGGGNRLK